MWIMLRHSLTGGRTEHRSEDGKMKISRLPGRYRLGVVIQGVV